eukprot:Nitzschia sp. Nitz4//scaffold149_size55946//29087//30935//NITZ4_006596-RA/size55946-augustus-gene-0.101-mRNA-1//-1//CDS//3329536815//400//frame0
MAENDDESSTVSRFFLFFAVVLAMVLLLTQCLHRTTKLKSVLSESSMILIVGMITSWIVSLTINTSADALDDENMEEVDLTETILSFPNKVFFLALLPPILFNSGYQLQRELFYRHLNPILLYSALGTLISGLVTGSSLYGLKTLGAFGNFDPTFLELLTFGALIAATDTVSVLGILQEKRVDPHLFSLVFGESALNDAVAIVLFHTFSSLLGDNMDDDDDMSLGRTIFGILVDFMYQSLGSPALGIVFAFGIATLFKWVDLRNNETVELSLFILLMYFPFLLAEECLLSGIVAIFFAGMSARRYIEPNVSDHTKKNAEVIFHLASYLAETCIFLELGLSVFGLSGSFQWRYIGCAVVATLFGRALSVYPISFAFNWTLTKRVDSSNPNAVMEEALSGGDDIMSLGTSSTNSSSTASSIRKRKTPSNRRDKKIPVNFMHFMWYGGLRGAVAYACAREFPDVYGHKDEMTATTMVIVFVTIVLMGGGTECLLSFLKIRTNVDQEEYMKAWRRQRRLKGLFHDFEYNFIYRLAVREASIESLEQSLREEKSARSAIMEDGQTCFQPLHEIQLIPVAQRELSDMADPHGTIA